jgi:hypothetical protein
MYQVPVSKSAGWWSIDDAQLKFLEFYNYPAMFFPHADYSVVETVVK